MEESGWDVVFPTAPDEEVHLDVLPPRAQGWRVLDLAARPQRGRQRWALALPLTGPDWDAEEPWARLMAEVTRGEVPVTAVEVEVR